MLKHAPRSSALPLQIAQPTSHGVSNAIVTTLPSAPITGKRASCVKPKLPLNSGVPVPPLGQCVYPFRDMKIGDSFFFELDARLVRKAACNWANRHHMKFTTRKLREDGKNGIRVWRIA